MKKHYLLAPGPTPVSPETLLAMATPIIHHRSPQFAEVVAECRVGLKYLFQTKQEVLILASTGTGAMEGAITNTLSPGDTALVVRGGKFGERWGEICAAYGVNFEAIDVEWGRAVQVADVAAKLKANPAIKAVCIQAHETSTGVNHPVKELAELTKSLPGTLLLVDAISALGAFELPMDAWGIDIMVAGSQKAMMLPPGLAFACLSEKAWEFTKTATCNKYYFNFSKELKNIQKNTGAYTSAVSLVMGLRDVLRYFKEATLEKIFAEHQLMSKATKAAVKALGLELFSQEGASDALTAVRAPAGVDGQDVVKLLRDKYGIMIAGGQAEAKGKIFRIAHMGYIGNFDIVMIIAALEVVLNELGYKAPYGAGVKAAEEVLFGGA
ncbi:pyridoxal-phosphate-dependent aminotransferase family protein [Desulfobacca acetoxidans]|uniref:Serine--glyoxylate transaminase n=1 Tax=Desulfobacca acetoxidans (strain ATCC 700848 / DSM 11109 / ASRB2) TaxID=880072 RepID=F2NCK0_DESAR|nr:alanine--glyoxylate aminotransferase family protein [Desulfobacca acetoxidans]AEB09134.1 Serine--glyoxylate transaminase [Desulfobacca acetoxidans DSM 11109]